MLTIGVTFHVMTSLTLGLYLFPITCFSTYFAFVNSGDVVVWAARWRRWKRSHVQGWQTFWSAVTRLPRAIGTGLAASAFGKFVGRRWNLATSLGAFGLLMGVTTIGAVELEYQLDPYGERRPEGRHTLKELPAEVVQRMFVGDVRLREYDKFLSFEVGTTMFAGVVTGRRETFRHGEPIIVQCTLSPPHEDMWVECNLHDASNVVIDRVGQVVVRSQLRGNFLYRACDALEPGDYYLVLKTGNREVTRRKIHIDGCDDGKCRVLAN
jgi:hypothetical protein